MFLDESQVSLITNPLTVFQIDSFPKVVDVDSSANVLIRVLESSRWDHRLRLDEIYLVVTFSVSFGDF